jgi:hypothetical protein
VDDVNFGTRFARYAKRVRRLLMYPYADGYIESNYRKRFVVRPDVLTLWARRPDIFVLLQELQIKAKYLMRSPAHESLVSGFLAHYALRELTISFGKKDLVEPFERIQAALLGICTGLRHITLDIEAWSFPEGFRNDIPMLTRWTTWTGNLVTHSSNVQHLHIGVPVNYADLRVLSSVRTLVTLHASLIFHVPSVPPPLPCGAFPALRSLTLEDYTGHAELSQNMLSCGVNSILEQCTLNIKGPLFTTDMYALLAAAGQHKRVTHLSINSKKIDGAEPTIKDTTILLHGLRPSELMKTLTLTLKSSFLLHEDHISHVLHLYPHLHTFQWHSGTDDESDWIPMSLEVFLAALKDEPAIRTLPVRIEHGGLPSAQAQVSFGSNRYCGKVRFKRSTFSREFATSIGKLLPNVAEYLVDT